VADRERRLVTPHRDPLAAALARAEAAEARRPAEQAEHPARWYAMRPGDYLAMPVILGGYPMGVLLLAACIRLALPLWAAGAALGLGLVWWGLALRWMHEGDR